MSDKPPAVPRADTVGKKLAISIMFNTVSVEIICDDSYEAEVLYDDLIERAKLGEGFSLSVLAKPVQPDDAHG
jgi:hypothetical protein